MPKKLLLTIIIIFGFTTIAIADDKKVIIGFKKNISTTEDQKIQKFHRSGGRLKRSHKLINAVSGQLPEEEIEKLRHDPTVAYIETDITVGVSEPLELIPLSQEYVDSWGVAKIGSNTAVAAGFTGAGIKVAVLDSGIDYSHPDLKDNYKGGYNFVSDNNDPFDDGYISHGTHIAGIIGARNNGTGVVGVAPEVSLYAVKVLGGMVMGDLSDILAGMEWAITNKMNVINMSIGAPINSAAFKDVCDRAYQAGIVIVAASGNTHSNSVEFPAAYDSVIAVSATTLDDPATTLDETDTIATFSNYGQKVELAAPGVKINSTLRGGGYGVLSGTSQATAHAAGAAAILFSKKISDTNGDGRYADDIRNLLGASATDLGPAGRDQYFGFGRIDLIKALAPPPPVTLQYTITRSHALPLDDVLKVPLRAGTYSVKVASTMAVQVAVKDADGIRKIKIETNCKEKKRDSTDAVPVVFSFKVSIGAEGTLIFLPGGKRGSTASISITPVP
ncbi:S8 family peptidase [Pelotalea chapellei]|uniref:S8 family peptidase n=1 Tax=Pelotalea chapellei TaxID=44671 RepID=A0ABS5UBM0_9BACT|nr:S8 family peptidase [Pelotalea chapellei]MBT1073045.1 S8 family peptidase [Pelotalea chapellei]